MVAATRTSALLKNVEHALNWAFETANAKRHYDGIVAKFANGGALTWLRRIDIFSTVTCVSP